tara:strand:+ start:947 stop:1834 length:888 start_codon:yes stop_codon:yes gene_type:complete
MIFSLFFFAPSYFNSQLENTNQIFPYFRIISLILSSLLTTFFSIALNNLIYEKDVIKKSNFVLAFVFLLINTPFVTNYKMMIFSFFLLMFLGNLFNLYKQKQPYSIVFNAGIILSVLSFYLSYTLMLFPLIILSTLVFRNISWRILVISALALFVPYLFVWTYQLFYNQELFLPEFKFNYISTNFHIDSYYLHQQIWFSVISLVFLCSIFELFRWMYKKSIKSRESFTIITFFLLISVFIFVFTEETESVFLSFIPVSIIISNFFIYHKKSYFSEIIFIMLLFSSVFYRLSMINM